MRGTLLGSSRSARVDKTPSPESLANTRFISSHVALSVLATVLLTAAICVLVPEPSHPAYSLGDTDDAVRLISVRDLLSGAPWFDTTLPRIGAPEPLVSHWSRLIDLPIAGLIHFLTPLFGAEQEELATRIVWPALLFFFLLLVVSREACRQVGPWGGALAIFLAATSMTAFFQFRPGRIDHHNAQVLCAIAGLLMLLRAWEEPSVGWRAGFLLGLGLAIGYEAIALVGMALAITASAALWWPRHGTGVLRAAIAATLTMATAMLLTIPPWRWLRIHCDSLALNLPVLAAGGTIGLWAGMVLGRTRFARFLIASMGVVAGIVGFAALEPACLAGPYGQVTPVLRSFLLDQVYETRSIFWLVASQPTQWLGTLGFLVAGTTFELARWYQRRDTKSSLAVAYIVLAGALGCWQIRLIPYASWLCVLSIARFAGSLPAMASISARVVGMAAALLLSQATQDALTLPFAASQPSSDPSCYLSKDIRQLRALPSGLVSANLSLSAFIAALTPHRVVAAPYHRLEQSILANRDILEGSLDEALKKARVLGVDYIALCNTPSPNHTPRGLSARLLGGEPIPSLQEVRLDSTQVIRVWRLIR